MRLKNGQEFSYLGYVHQTWYNENQADEREIAAALRQFSLLAGPVKALMPMFYVLDYSSRQYMVFTDSVKHILGYDAREFLESGLGFALHILQKDFFSAYDAKLFPAIVDALKRIPQPEHRNHLFSHNLQVRNMDGKYVHTLHRTKYITSKNTGKPLYSVGMIMDISAFKKDAVMAHMVERIDPVAYTFRNVETKYFYPYEEDGLLTKQELNIVKYMSEGMSSKMIAFKLGLSENTIANHRKNMLRKTNTKNVAQLITFVITNGII